MPTFQGSTIQKAIETGLKQLGLPRDAVSVEVVRENKNGFLGLMRKPAIVNLKPLEPPIDADPTPSDDPPAKPRAGKKLATALTDGAGKKIASAFNDITTKKRDNQTALAMVQSYLEDITTGMGIDTQVTSERQGNTVTFQLKIDEEGLLIGKHGKIINAIQYLAQTEFNHYAKSKWTIMLDVGDYRERRQATVTRLAERTAREVLATGKAVYLDPMPSFERKTIHTTLVDNTYVETHSEGVDPRRYVVVTPKRP